MKRKVRVWRNLLSAGFLGLVLVPWWPSACQRKPQATPSPPPLTQLEMGEKYFEAGDYAQAAQAYDLYLRDNPSGPNQDRALFRLALAHAFPGSPVHDLPRANELLKQLVHLHTQSPFRAEAEFLLGLQDEADRLRADVSHRDERIRELTQELERLKRIDMQRRPSRLPP